MDFQLPVVNPQRSNYSKAVTATEDAFQRLIARAAASGLKPRPVMGLVYLPTQAVTRQFEVACRAVLQDLGVDCQPPDEDPDPALAK
jgi:hypothetical protein